MERMGHDQRLREPWHSRHTKAFTSKRSQFKNGGIYNPRGSQTPCGSLQCGLQQLPSFTIDQPSTTSREERIRYSGTLLAMLKFGQVGHLRTCMTKGQTGGHTDGRYLRNLTLSQPQRPLGRWVLELGVLVFFRTENDGDTRTIMIFVPELVYPKRVCMVG